MKKAIFGLITLGAVGGGAYFFLANREISDDEKNKASSEGKDNATIYCDCIKESKTNPEKVAECQKIDQEEQKKFLALIMHPDVQMKQKGLAAKDAWTEEKGKCVD